MNIYDVSNKAGVSIATVSRVLNGNPNVSEKTRKKVLAVMEELGYTPNAFARGLGLNTMKTIGILCLDSSDPFLANAVFHLEQNLKSHNYDTLLCCTGYDLETKQKYLNLLLSKRVDAIILVGSSFLEPIQKDNAYLLAAADIVPLVIINGYINHPNIYCSLCDDYQAIYDLTTRIVESGRKRILYLFHSKSYCGLLRLNGYKDAIPANGLELDENLIFQCTSSSLIGTKDELIKAYNDGLRFDAVIAAEDIHAVSAIKFARTLGISIPNELIITGFNNSILSTCCEPELTTVDNHIEMVCLSAIHTLMRVFEGKEAQNKTMISNDLVIRETTDFQ